jgi:hypothetical protein
MQHAIFKAAVRVHNQEESDVVEQLCKKYSLPIWKGDNPFEYLSRWSIDFPLPNIYFYFNRKLSDENNGFIVNPLDSAEVKEYNIVFLEEFKKLAKDYTLEYETIDEIINKLNEINKILNNK